MIAEAPVLFNLSAEPQFKPIQQVASLRTGTSEWLRYTGSAGERPPSIVPVLVYNGAPAWTPQSSAERNGFEYTFIDVGRLRPDEARSHEPVAALSSPTTAIERARR